MYMRHQTSPHRFHSTRNRHYIYTSAAISTSLQTAYDLTSPRITSVCFSTSPATAMASATQALAHNLNASERTHFVLVPMMAQGHTIPMTDMAYLLAKHGAQVSFITTPLNASRITGFIDHVAAAGLAIQFVKLHFPAVEFGLPEGCENADMLKSRDLFKNFLDACAALREPLVAYLSQQRQSPSCIISDMMHWWTGDIAREFGIPRLTFNGFCGFAYLARYIIVRDNLLEHVEDENELISFPGFPTLLELTKAKCPGSLSVPCFMKAQTVELLKT